METDLAFRKVWMSSRFAGSDDEQVQFAEDFEKLADLEEFLEYQDQLHLEEAARELLDVEIQDCRTLGPSKAFFSFFFFSLSSQSQAALFYETLCVGLFQWLRRCSVVPADNILRFLRSSLFWPLPVAPEMLCSARR